VAVCKGKDTEQEVESFMNSTQLPGGDLKAYGYKGGDLKAYGYKGVAIILERS
jgi:hypothetical protein